MKCYECGGEYRERREVRFRVDDKTIGTFYADDISFMECAGCGERLFASKDAKKLESARHLALESILQGMPLGEFMSAADTAAVLDISRQALHKHRRISRGLIYHTAFGGGKVYLKKSVERFRAKGDGRYRLREAEPQPLTYENGPKETAGYPVVLFGSTGFVATGNGGITKLPHIARQCQIKETSYA